MVFGTNEENLPNKFNILDFIGHINEHLPNLKFERVVLSCENMQLTELEWFMKRTGALVIQKVEIMSVPDMATFENLLLNQNQLQELTLIIPQIAKLFDDPPLYTTDEETNEQVCIEFTKIKLPA